ncbi:LEAF RUST 10 DISEASE-RESISTANCE LOCUS RECEPTOR-LIKE PROTEIN KINASE-like 1.1 isoform X1 [Vitis riparia]|uniref:LEAF RUST 10 DISEASE-RESISTANCE LOCUS RECEPTOR-LIKE PROTEIN KINASE-like 1.1 isoform X1 n=1 Tax=Vitis riparia TaxID=96939 RepID=UPI00155A96EE|nr:LEAF RUST 10 DISEASE-RESISTANCE LOCUS RECEPTOR-LIKE PROTEIN KINASE-like 1.1 isoform X1 [Vitis riparia]
MLLLLNWGFRMGSVSFLVLFLLSHSVLLSSAEEERKQPPTCPPFDCEKLGRLHFPFKNETNSECGLCTIERCTEELPRIQLERGGRYFGVKNISQADTIVIQDDLLKEYLQRNICKFIDNLTSSLSPSVSFTPVPTLTATSSLSPSVSFAPVPTLTVLTLFKCHRNHNIDPITEYNYTRCHDFIIYYNQPNTSIPPPPPPPHCSIIQYPVNMNLDIADLFPLLTSDITLQVLVSPGCWRCHHRTGQCQDDGKGKFHCAHVKGNEKRLKLALGLGISAGSITILIICFFIIWQSHKREYAPTFLSRNTSSDPSSKSELEITGAYFGIPIFPYTELEEATNYFDPDREIGDGGFGTVYHGQLRDGREVAVKRLYENNYRRVEQFMNEVKILTRLRHRNLVSLYGCTSRHSRELLLVYEFIPNGTVADHLHGDRADSGLLTWPIRLSIAIETATALSYLHASDVVHRDVKTNNILLDNSFCVKVADFGLSRLFPTDVTHVSTAPQGTPGYVDPEYHQCYQLTDKSDVYSFGVVLIELISSLPAVDISRHRHEINLSNYAINKIQKCAFHELIDPHLGFNSDLAVNRMTTLVAELAFRCLQPDKEMRPSMDEVLEILKEIESDKHELENMDTAADSFGSSMRKPPSPSPDCDEVGLLKSVQLMPSPDTVIAQWPSRSTTPSASA